MPHAAFAVTVAGIGLVSLTGCGSGSGDASDPTISTTVVTGPTTTTTSTACISAEPPAKPSSPFELNGKPWPKMCLTTKKEAHFFGIGDWGGDKQDGHTWLNPSKCGEGARPCKDADNWAQKYVAARMVALAKDVPPDFVLNAGDNFYPGGITQLCGKASGGDPTGQFGKVFDSIYKGEGLTGKPWFGVFGNHDWGGREFHAGVDVQVMYTWESDVWRAPALFWSQTVQYDGFSMDFFMLDSNFIDAMPVGSDLDHNICQDRQGNGTTDCFGLKESNCRAKFHDFWMESVKMLEEGLKTSTADWKIINTHFPGVSIAIQPEIQKLNEEYGIDLLFTGHTHSQMVGEEKGIPYIISGGGGGVTSDTGPLDDGKDAAYGFVHFTATKDTLTYEMHTWGGVKGETIILNTQTIKKKDGVRQQPEVRFHV